MNLDSWQWRNPLPQGNDIDGVAFGNGTFVAVTRAGSVMTSTDTVHWTMQELCSQLSAVRFLNNRFVAVGSHGSIFTSTDGYTWNPQVSQTTHGLSDVAYGNGTFVAIGYCDVITWSLDGTNWTSQSSGVPGKEGQSFWGISFGNNIFLITGPDRTVLRSVNGIVWDDKSVSWQDDLGSITFGNGYFVTINRSGVLRSIDGGSWDPAVFAADVTLCSVDHLNGRFVAVGMRKDGTGGDDFAAIFTSIDGRTWTDQVTVTPVTREWLFCTTFGNGTYLIGGFGGTILTSHDAAAWVRKVNTDSSALFTGIAYGNGTFVAVGARSRNQGLAQRPLLVSSSDLETWTEVSCPTASPLSDVVYTGDSSTLGRFVAVGRSASILVSENGFDWRPRSVPQGMAAITINNGTLIGAGSDAILRWTKTTQWTEHRKGTTGLHSVAYGMGFFVAVGDDGTILTSNDDGLSWTGRYSRITTPLRGVAFGNNRFVAVSIAGQVLTSTDAKRWDIQSDNPYNRWTGISYSPQIPGFIALSNSDSSLFTSPDGVSWTQRKTGILNNSLHACTYGNGSFFAVGGKNAIVQSEVFGPLHVERPVSNVASPQKSGSVVTWHCTASGGPRLRYAFTLTRLHGLRPPGQPLTPKLVYQATPDFTATLSSAGTYVVTAHVRDGNGTVISRDSLPFVVT